MIPRSLALFASIAIVSGSLAASGGAEPPGSPPTDPKPAAFDKRLDAWWADLEAEDFEAARALLSFADRPAEAVAYFKEQLKPVKLDAVRLKALLLRLGSDNEAPVVGAAPISCTSGRSPA